MLALRIIATCFLGVSCLTTFVKNYAVETRNNGDREMTNGEFITWLLWTLYGWLWRAFCIVAVWVVA